MSLADAVRIGLGKHPVREAAASDSRAAELRIAQARSGLLPRVGWQEAYIRSDNPVFVFSTLLTQRRFAERNFAIAELNRPDALNNFQSLISVDQTVWDWGATRSQIRTAELQHGISREEERRTERDLIVRIARAWHNVALARERLAVSREARQSAEADLERARTVREAGMSTDADVLSIRVHLASVRESEIRAGYDAQFAVSALNEALGLPINTPQNVNAALLPAAATPEVESLTAAALDNRSEIRQLRLAEQAAGEQIRAARTAVLPQFGVRGTFEADRNEFVRKGGANWMFTGSMRWNLFDGFATRARVGEASAQQAAARARQRAAEAGARLDVQRAWVDYRSAQERISVAEAAVAEAEESLRIIRNRYSAGLATATDLLRNETALLETRLRRLSAVHDQRLAAIGLEYAAGTLSADSGVLQ